jgi:hypothetical protein
VTVPFGCTLNCRFCNFYCGRFYSFCNACVWVFVICECIGNIICVLVFIVFCIGFTVFVLFVYVHFFFFATSVRTAATY